MASENVLNRVKELREKRGWTQQDLADAVGVSRQSINSIERQRYVPSLPLALLFARAFHVATDDLFRLETEAVPVVVPRRIDDFTD
jgi:putative transcriptional regulator